MIDQLKRFLFCSRMSSLAPGLGGLECVIFQLCLEFLSDPEKRAVDVLVQHVDRGPGGLRNSDLCFLCLRRSSGADCGHTGDRWLQTLLEIC